MTRFVFLTDTHLGAINDVGYTQQPRYVDRLGELVAVLDDWIAHQDEPGIDFVLHGGDMVDVVTGGTLAAARETFALSVPLCLALGNHDLTAPDSTALWLSAAPLFFPGGQLAYSLNWVDWMLHVLPTQWCEVPYTWADEQNPHFLPEHLASLEATLAQYPDLAHVICTHAQVLPVSALQIGRSVPYHPPLPSYRDVVEALVHRFPQVKGIIGGHNHINTHGFLGGVHTVTASAFTEAPFEFKVFEVSGDHLSMETVSLMPRVNFRADYNWDKTFVQGRRCDRAFDTRDLGNT